MKHYKSVEILSIFSVKPPSTNPKAPAKTQSPPIENFLATVLPMTLLYVSQQANSGNCND